MYRKLGILFYLPDNVKVTQEDMNNFYWEENAEKVKNRLKDKKPFSMKSVSGFDWRV